METPAKRSRAGKPKVRTGCLICKARKVKCDENKPECNRCKKLDIHCSYTSQKLILAPKSSASFVPIKPRQAIGQNPSSSIPGDESEHRYFQLFLDKLSYDLCGYFETPFWTQLIPQECHHEPAIRHAIFALSALYKSSASRNHTLRATDQHMEFALVQQSKAISSFRKSLSIGQPQVRLALTASLLFGCFESFHGNWETAWQQMHGGLNILGQCRRNQGEGQLGSIVETDSELGEALIRLQLQLETFLAMNPMVDSPLMQLEEVRVEEYPPLRFVTLAEAFPFALNLAISAIRYSRRTSRALNFGTDEQSLEDERDTLCDFVFRWKRAFRPLLLEAETGQLSGQRNYLGILLLQTCVQGFEIILATSLSRKENIFDHYTEEFRRIVFQCRRIFQLDAERREVEDLKAQFGLGSVMVLYYTATRCREWSIRHEAISILREWPRKNGIWDSLQAAQVAEWIVGVEEEAAYGMENIPEEARIRTHSLKVTRDKGGLQVECLQGKTEETLRPRKAILECH